MKKILLIEHKNSKMFYLPFAEEGSKYLVEDLIEGEVVEISYYFAKWAMCSVFSVGDVDRLPNEALVALINHYHEVAL